MTRIFPSLAALLVLASLPAIARAQDRERCYGVSPSGENDGIGREEAPGSSTVDYQGDAWAWVEEGACLTISVPAQPDGTPRRGALEPLDRDSAQD